MNTPTVYKYNEQLLTETEALTLITERLTQSSGHIMLDIEYIQALDKLDAVGYSAEKRQSVGDLDNCLRFYPRIDKHSFYVDELSYFKPSYALGHWSDLDCPCVIYLNVGEE